ncbi:hypothetical protein OHB54_03705 [Streptomyces sp. NBC_01007]|nr:hypothetical protein OHB54_03705 [Streptomyces sp. NBC_01007]
MALADTVPGHPVTTWTERALELCRDHGKEDAGRAGWTVPRQVRHLEPPAGVLPRDPASPAASTAARAAANPGFPDAPAAGCLPLAAAARPHRIRSKSWHRPVDGDE